MNPGQENAHELPAGRPWALIAANPYSGIGENEREVARLADALERRGIESQVIWDPTEWAEALKNPERVRSCLCVVATGGDGTVADVINCRPSSLPLAVMPLGAENLFALEFGFKRDAEGLAAAIGAGKCRSVDLGRANGRFFSLMASVGFDADVVHRVARWRSRAKALKRVTRLSYLWPILNAALRYSYPRLTIEADGVTTGGAHAMVFNLPQYGYHLPFAPHARGDDGLLDWIVFERAGFGNLVSYFRDARRSRHLARPDMRHGRARRIRITAAEPVPAQLDGDPAGHTPVEIEVTPAALSIVTP